MTATDQFAQFLVSGLTTGAVYALVAVGFSLVHNAARIVNFAQGDFLSLGGLLLYSLGTGLGLAPLLGLPLAVAGAAVMGAVLERLCLRPATKRDTVTLIFITVAASILLRGVFKILWGKEALFVPPFTSGEPIGLLGAVFTPQNLWVVGVTAASIAALGWFFKHTLAGRAMRAAAVNPRAAALMGIDPGRATMLAFGLAGALGALAGVCITPITSLSYDVGVLMGLKGFAAAVLGGYGSFVGAVVGGAVLGLLESLGAGLLSSVYKDVIAFVVLLAVLFVRPGGIMGVAQGHRGRG